MLPTLIIAFFLLFIGAVATFMGVKLIALNRSVKTFVAGNGKLIKKWVEEKKLASATEPGNTHCVYVEYEFEVDGKMYKGDSFYAAELLGGERAMSPKQAQKKVDQITASPVIYYNPINPKESYMYKGNNMAWLVLVLGMILLLGGVVHLIVSLVE